MPQGVAGSGKQVDGYAFQGRPGNPGEASTFGSKAKMRASPEATSQNKIRAPEILGVSLITLHHKLKEH